MIYYMYFVVAMTVMIVGRKTKWMMNAGTKRSLSRLSIRDLIRRLETRGRYQTALTGWAVQVISPLTVNMPFGPPGGGSRRFIGV